MNQEDRAVCYATKGAVASRRHAYCLSVELRYWSEGYGWAPWQCSLDFESGDWNQAYFRMRPGIYFTGLDVLRYDLNTGCWWVTGCNAEASRSVAGTIQFSA